MSNGPPTGPAVVLTCIAGPDNGKRISIADAEIAVGRSAQCNIPSDDPDVMDRHVVFHRTDGLPSFTAGDGAAVFVDGNKVGSGVLLPQQQLRIGRSLWQVAGPGVSSSSQGFTDILDTLGGKISSVAGVEKIQGFNVAAMFSEAFRKHTDDEIENYFSIGTPSTTPDILQVDTNWPKPWVFLRTFALAFVVYFCFAFAAQFFSNRILIPGLLIVGAFAIPFSILIFFFEVNVVRNISLYQTIRMVMLGGILSLVASLFLFRTTQMSSWLGPMAAGIIEEIGKTAALLIIANKTRFRWTLNGLLFGAAVGAGFSGFETAGYAYINILKYNSWDLLYAEIQGRGIACLLADHTLWSAIVGAALWRVKGDKAFSIELVRDIRFLRALGLAMALHFLNNSPIPNPFYLKYLALGFVAWVVILSFIQDGLKQVRAEQERLRGEVKT